MAAGAAWRFIRLAEQKEPVHVSPRDRADLLVGLGLVPAQFQHVPQQGDAMPLWGDLGQRLQRRFHGGRIGVVAVVHQE